MKKKQIALNKKLQLVKKTIVNLDPNGQSQVVGGGSYPQVCMSYPQICMSDDTSPCGPCSPTFHPVNCQHQTINACNPSQIITICGINC